MSLQAAFKIAFVFLVIYKQFTNSFPVCKMWPLESSPIDTTIMSEWNKHTWGNSGGAGPVPGALVAGLHIRVINTFLFPSRYFKENPKLIRIKVRTVGAESTNGQWEMIIEYPGTIV